MNTIQSLKSVLDGREQDGVLDIYDDNEFADSFDHDRFWQLFYEETTKKD